VQAAAADSGIDDPGREERRRIRRRRRVRLEAARLGDSRGGLKSKVHLSGERRCRPLSLELTEGQAANSLRFILVLEKVRVRGPVGRPRTRSEAWPAPGVTGPSAHNTASVSSKSASARV
jgi:hypothetical protein